MLHINMSMTFRVHSFGKTQILFFTLELTKTSLPTSSIYLFANFIIKLLLLSRPASIFEVAWKMINIFLKWARKSRVIESWMIIYIILYTICNHFYEDQFVKSVKHITTILFQQPMLIKKSLVSKYRGWEG